MLKTFRNTLFFKPLQTLWQGNCFWIYELNYFLHFENGKKSKNGDKGNGGILI